MRTVAPGAGWRRGLWVFAALLCYLAPATRLDQTIVHWASSGGGHGHEEGREHAHEREIFPCAVHKCQCQNALECRTRCCCFPKGGHAASESSGTDPAGNIRACGGPLQAAALASLPPHVPIPDSGIFPASTVQGRAEEPVQPLLDPASGPPWKIPIPA